MRKTYANPVPSRNREDAEGVTTKTYGLCNEDYEVCTIYVKLINWKFRAPAILLDEDIVYSPNKYRETEGKKEIKRREL